MPHRNTPKVSHLLAQDLRRQILRGEIAADEQLPPEAELIALLGVSRDTLREAFRILESQSLLEIRRGRGGGAVVRRPGLDAVGRYVALLLQLRKTTLAHIEEARSVIEPVAAAQVARTAGSAELDRLVELHDAERNMEHDALSFVTAVAAFDQAVIELTGNKTLGVIAGVFRDIHAGQIYAALGTTDPTSSRRIARHVIVSHSALLDATRRGDPDLAQNTWSDYLFTTSRMLVNRSIRRQPLDMSSLWRARAGLAGDGPAPRRALAVAAEIRARIAEGRLREGDRLPSLADLATEFDISRPTLREALRILEMEFLLELRSGDRGGAIIRTPTTKVASQQAGIVLEARQADLADFYRALRQIEPGIMELVADRIGQRQLKGLRGFETELAATVEDTERFMVTWWEAEMQAFSATKNPALTIVAEILQWVRIGVEPAIAVDWKGLPWLTRSNRKAQRRFVEFVSAMSEGDSAGARDIWAECLDASAPFIEDSELGERLMIDLTAE